MALELIWRKDKKSYYGGLKDAGIPVFRIDHAAGTVTLLKRIPGSVHYQFISRAASVIDAKRMAANYFANDDPDKAV